MKSYTNVRKTIPPDYMAVHTSNHNIKVYHWIVMPQMMLEAAIQLQLLVCITKAREGVLFGKTAFNQLAYWKHYTNRIIYIKQLAIPLVVEKSIQV